MAIVGLAYINAASRISVGKSPYPIMVSPSGAYLYVGNTNSSTVSVINASENKVVATIGTCFDPKGMAITTDGRYLLVVCTQSISVLNLTSNKLVDSLGYNGAGYIRFGNSESGATFYFLNSSFSTIPEYGNVWIANTSTASIMYAVATAYNASTIRPSSNGRYVYETVPYQNVILVTNSLTNNTVSVPLGPNFTQSGSTGTYHTPIYIELSPDGKYIYVAESDGGIDILNASDYGLVHAVQTVCGGLNPPDSLDTSANPNYLYAICGNSIIAINTTTGIYYTVVPFIKGPFQIAFGPSNRYMYVVGGGNQGASIYYIVDLNSDKIVWTVGSPSVITPDGRYVYTTNKKTDSVSVTKLG
ncbi:MAG: YncE family protein [Candidatus Micrarchaeota archaeon]|nr:YncE family protein [Candidatus Micrarchaeota archaeon]